jgi:hypothetical protein
MAREASHIQPLLPHETLRRRGANCCPGMTTRLILIRSLFSPLAPTSERQCLFANSFDGLRASLGPCLALVHFEALEPKRLRTHYDSQVLLRTSRLALSTSAWALFLA